MLGLSFSSKLDYGIYMVFITKTGSKKISFLYISINLPYFIMWNTVVMSELVSLATTWIC